MIFAFAAWELDTGRYELRRDGKPVHVEPLVFDLLALLVRHRDRVVTRDEIIAEVWQGRIVSDAAVSSCLRSARQVLGDDGKQQRLIRTAHGRGFRFVAEVTTTIPATAAEPEPMTAEAAPVSAQPPASGAPSIAVLPFKLVGMPGAHWGIADALPHDLISALSRLRWLFVIARGSTFRFRSGRDDLQTVGDALGARYCLSGTIDIFAGKISITVELTDTRDGGVVWSDHFDAPLDGIHEIRAQIVSEVAGALEIHIPAHEAQRARLSAPQNLDAWSLYHLGLHHMYRFTRPDNQIAADYFERCLAAEPGFARGHAGLSFTHFQNAFLRYTEDAASGIDGARRHAAHSIELDPLDPFANFTMGRSFWLAGDLESSLAWLDRAISVSPNYAQGRYARGWADAVSGRGVECRSNVDMAMSLSPLDPLHYAMQCTRALSLINDGKLAEAVIWADRAARAPGAHFLIGVVAVIAHSLAGEPGKANAWVDEIRARRPDATQDHFFRSFPYRPGPLRSEISRSLSLAGFS